MTKRMSLETDIELDDGAEVAKTDYEMSKRRKGIIKVASASSLCANFAVDTSSFLRKHNTEKLLLRRKLNLVINLDHVLLTYTSHSRLTPEEQERLKTLADSEDVFTVQVPTEMEPVIIKLRPKLRDFLEEASEFFEIYAYANAPRSLVWKIVELLDPRNDYFGRRVVSRDDFHTTHKGKGKMSLDLVLGQKSAVLVLDNNIVGWEKSSWNNIIVLSKYPFFQKGGNKKRKRKSLCELKSDAPAYFLASNLRFLKRIHNSFFNDEVICDNLFDRDVRVLLKIECDARGGSKLQLQKKAIANCMLKRVKASCSYQQMKMVQQFCVEEQADDPSTLEDVEIRQEMERNNETSS